MASMFSFMRQFLYSQLFVTLPYPIQDFTGQTVIVTGANTGLGLEAAKHFVRLNASKVIIACRSLEKGQAAKDSIERALNHSDKSTIEIWQLDLASYESVKDFASKVSNTLSRLDVIVENAGIGTKKLALMEGMESSLTTNVISTELLALLVLPKMRETAMKFNVTPRLSIVTSDLHFLVHFPERREGDIFAALNDPSTPNIYQVTKLLQVLFIRSLASHLSPVSINNQKREQEQQQQPQVIVNCMTPGACHSDLFREASFFEKASVAFMKFFIGRTTEQGARTLLAGASAGRESHGMYMADCVVARPSELVMSEEGRVLQTRLWEQTVRKLETIQPGISGNIR